MQAAVCLQARRTVIPSLATAIPRLRNCAASTAAYPPRPPAATRFSPTDATRRATGTGPGRACVATGGLVPRPPPTAPSDTGLAARPPRGPWPFTPGAPARRGAGTGASARTRWRSSGRRRRSTSLASSTRRRPRSRRRRSACGSTGRWTLWPPCPTASWPSRPRTRWTPRPLCPPPRPPPCPRSRPRAPPRPRGTARRPL
mmetsp:Transcript_32864/g.82916  ORF Transcript_32864/g.82916 Transcript_32864/m.82916 type:complete len:201 (-) Transcript_32864:437-1039(-)